MSAPMKRVGQLALAAAWALLGPVALASHQSDGITLMLDHGPGPGEVTLRWTGGVAPFSVYRSTSASGIIEPANLVGQTPDSMWIDAGSAAGGAIFYYEISGSGCADGSECPSGFCSDGVCCDRACDGACESCNLPIISGTCTPIPAGSDPDDECAGASTCNASGFCELERTCRPPVLGECHPYLVSQNVVVNVLDFGANGDDGYSDAADDTAAFLRAIAAIPSVQGGVLLVPAGLYVIRETLVIDKAAPVHVLGVGSTGSPRGSVLYWRGSGGGPVFRLVGLSDSRLEGIGITVLDPFHLDVAIQSETLAGRATIQNTFKELQLASQTYQLADGFRFVAGDDVGGSGPDIGNDCHCFERVIVNNYTGTAYRFMHPSSGGHLFSNSGFVCTGYSSGRSGLSTEPAPGRIGGGGFTWMGVGGGNCDVSDFELAEPNSPVTIEGFTSEISHKALISVGPSVSSQVSPVEYRSNRFETTVAVNAPQITYDFPGTLTVEGTLLAFLGEAKIEMHPPLPGRLIVANNNIYDLAGDPSGRLDFGVVDAGPNVSVEFYGNQFARYLDGPPADYYADRYLFPTPPPALPNPPPPGPALLSGPLPPPNNVELLMTTSVYNVTDPAYGAVPNDGIDDTSGFQAAIDTAMAHHQGGIVHAPAGTYLIKDSLFVSADRVLKFRGDGSASTILIWIGPPDRPLLLLDGQRDSVFGYFSIRTMPGQPLHAGIVSKTQDLVSHQRIPTNLAFYDIVIDGAGGLDYGWRISPGLRPDGTWGDYNNENHYFVECEVRDYSIAGYSVEHSQAKMQTFINSRFDGGHRGQYGVATLFGRISGSFRWTGGSGGGNLIADFGLGGSDDFILVRDGTFRDSSRLLAAGFETGAWNINFYRNRWASSAAYLAPDAWIVDHNKGGPLVFQGNIFDLADPVIPPPADAQIRHNSWFPATTTAIGNEFRWSGSDAPLPMPGCLDPTNTRFCTPGPYDSRLGNTHERTLRGNIYRDAAFLPVVRPTEP